MRPPTTSTPDGSIDAGRRRSLLRAAATGAIAATSINVLLWIVGAVAGASLRVSSPLGGPPLAVGIVAVLLTTVLMIILGTGLLALAARRSRRWARAVLISAGAVAVITAAAPLLGGHDPLTGGLLATMHLATGVAFILAGRRRR